MVEILRARSVLASGCVFRLSLGNVYRGPDPGEREKLTGRKEAQGNFH
jgi:hypothetical protein